MPEKKVLDLLAIFHRKRPLSPSPSQENDQHLLTPWRPIYLRRLVILCFAFIACVMIVTLEILNYISNSHNGLASSVERLHYAWTYTPTAILTLTSALWARTEFQAKQNAPWQSMQEPEQAHKSLLLDYDDIPPVALWKSLKHRHFLVAAGISCSLLLQLAILFSTSLLSLQKVGVTSMNVPIQLEDIFDGDNPTFNHTQLAPFDVLNEIQFESTNYPSGTSRNLAYQRFTAPNASEDSVITAPITAMEANLDCEPATLEIDHWVFELSHNSWYGTGSSNFKNKISTPSCTITNVTIDDAQANGYSHYVAQITEEVCGDIADNTTNRDQSRLLVVATQYHEGKVLLNDTNSKYPEFYTRKWELVLDNSVQFICKPRLSFVHLQATANLSEPKATPHFKRTGREDINFANLSAWDISQQIMQGSAGLGLIGDFGTDRPIAEHPAFLDRKHLQKAGSIDFRLQLGAWIAGKTGEAQKMFQEGVLEDAASSFYRSMGAQLIHNGLAKQKNTQTNGSAFFYDDRVLVMQSPLRVVEVCLAISALVAVTMVLLGPNDGCLSQNPSNISTIANIMSNSDSLRQSLHRAGELPLDALGEKIHGSKYFIRNHRQGVSIDVDNDHSCDNRGADNISPARPEHSSPKATSSWKPFPALCFRIPVFFLMVGMIIALEILLHVSQKNSGLGQAWNDERMHYLWTTLPSLIMMLVALLIGSLDFNTRILSPYACLQRPQGASSEALATNFLDALRTTNLFHSARTKNFAVFSTTLAALISSFFTIVTSGLFSTAEVPQIDHKNFTQGTVFKSPDLKNLTTLTMDTSTLIIGNYILYDNLTYPKWTYDDLVFPEVTLDVLSNWSTKQDSYADIRVPAIRGSPDCVFSTGKALNYSITDGFGYPVYGSQGQSTASGAPYDLKLFNIGLNAPNRSCPVPGTNGSVLENWKTGQNVKLALPDNGYFGQTVPFACLGSGEAANSSLTAYIWGYFENHTMHHISSMTCAGMVETVDTVTRFQLPDFDIPSDYPPRVDESSAKINPDINGVWSIYALDILNQPSQTNTTSSLNTDAFFTALTEGRYKIPKEFLRSPQHDERVQKAIKHQENVIKAQLLKRYAREAANGTLDDKPLSGNLTLPKNFRVFQDEASTRVLEVMLGLALLLCIVGSVLMNTDHVLPKSPGSIAAVGSLLADSNFLHLCSFTSKNPSYGLLHDCRFHLGWLDENSESESSSELDEKKKNRYLTIYMKTHGETRNDEDSGTIKTPRTSVRQSGTMLERTWI